MEIPEKARDVLDKAKYVRVGTCSDGVPNINIVYYCKMIDEDKLLLADNYFNKTEYNLEQNPYMAVSARLPGESTAYELKGAVDIYTSGPTFEEMRRWVRSDSEDMPAKAAVVLNVERVFDQSPGDGAGKEVNPS
ncbi:MAG: pyridoxamine 5'-phosphate oxidase family protein [Candidatus Acetothermia bacterium]